MIWNCINRGFWGICAEGSRQGAAEAGIAASAAIQEPLESADEALATACEGFVHTDFDDMYLCGEPAAVAQALTDFETAIALVGACNTQSV